MQRVLTHTHTHGVQETIDTIPALEAKLVELDETKGELQQVRATLESTEGRMAHLEKVHERDTKARTSASMKMKQAVVRGIAIIAVHALPLVWRGVLW